MAFTARNFGGRKAPHFKPSQLVSEQQPCRPPLPPGLSSAPPSPERSPAPRELRARPRSPTLPALLFGSPLKSRCLAASSGERLLFNRISHLKHGIATLCEALKFWNLVPELLFLMKVAGGDEQLRGVHASVSHGHRLRIAHFDVVHLSPNLRMDSWGYFLCSIVKFKCFTAHRH